MSGHIVAVGPLGVFTKDDLSHDWHTAHLAGKKDTVLIRVARAETPRETAGLARLCGLLDVCRGWWRVKALGAPDGDEWIAGEPETEIARRLKRLHDAGCALWFHAPKGGRTRLPSICAI